jgi:hypothetical protein
MTEWSEYSKAHRFMVSMAWDAFYIALGKKPKRHAVDEVCRWLRHISSLRSTNHD